MPKVIDLESALKLLRRGKQAAEKALGDAAHTDPYTNTWLSNLQRALLWSPPAAKVDGRKRVLTPQEEADRAIRHEARALRLQAVKDAKVRREARDAEKAANAIKEAANWQELQDMAAMYTFYYMQHNVPKPTLTPDLLGRLKAMLARGEKPTLPTASGAEAKRLMASAALVAEDAAIAARFPKPQVT